VLTERPSPRVLAIETPRLFDGEHLLGPRRIEVIDGRIVAVMDAGQSLETSEVVRLPETTILAPGFIDIQVNGGGDALLNDDPSLETITRIAHAHRRFGTTSLLPTLITDHPDKLDQLLAIADDALTLAGVVGFHLEGPHLNPIRKGIHPPQFVRPMTDADRAKLLRFAGIGRSFLTLAPELVPGETIAGFARAGLRVSAGHTEAAAGQIAVAANHGPQA
jgi:N-acetylglucosamine-6-phosphate deacetylase